MRHLAIALLTAIFSIAPASAGETKPATLTVFAAASLKTALDQAAAAFTAKSGTKVQVSYAGSSALAKQIEQGAPADVFISADTEWMDYLAKKDLIRSETRFDFLGNTLVLIAPATSKVSFGIAKGFDLAGAIGDGKLAVADTKAVPAGKYAKAALEALEVWTAVEPKLAQAENVRAALALVAREEAPLGIVYATDAGADKAVKIVGTFPEDTHAKIIYPLAITKDAANASGAEAMIAYLKSADGKAAFTSQGFKVLE